MLTCDGYAIENKIIRFFMHEYDELMLNTFNSTKDVVVRTASVYKYDSFILKILNETQKVIDRFSIKNELIPFHFEWFYSVETEELVFCEVGKRFGGASIPFLVEYAFNVNILSEYWSILSNGFEEFDQKNITNINDIIYPNKIACSYSPQKIKGVVKSIPKQKNFDWTINTWIFIKPGDKIYKAQNIVESLLISEFTAVDEDEYKCRLEKLRKLTAEIIIEEDNDKTT